MPVTKVNNLQYPRHPGQHRVGSGGHAHGDRVEISGAALMYSDDTRSGSTVSSRKHAVVALDAAAAVAFFLLNR